MTTLYERLKKPKPLPVSPERAKTIAAAIWNSGGYNDGCYPNERKNIIKYWETLPSHTTFYDAVCRIMANQYQTSERKRDG